MSVYVPPPPPPTRGRSPWLWIGLGCGLLVLLLFGGCVAVSLIGVNQMRRAASEPLTEQQILAALAGVPIYPGAKPDIPASQQMRAVTRTVGGLAGAMSGGKIRMEMAVFRAPAAPDTILAWYDKKLAGWKRVEPQRQQQTRGITHARQYARGERQVLVQAGSGEQFGGGDAKSDAGQKSKDSVLILFSMTGVPQQP